jgi:biotin transport system substrate-specific component
MNPNNSLRMTVFASLFAALIAAGAFIAIPIGPVPIVLQNLFVLLAGLLLPAGWAVASVGVYLLAGCLGLPVFAGGIGGIGRLFGPTGGYLLGYLPAVWLVSTISRRFGQKMAGDVAAAVIGSLVVYALGVTGLALVTGMPAAKAIAFGMYPFLIGDAVKIAAAVALAKTLRPILDPENGTYHVPKAGDARKSLG